MDSDVTTAAHAEFFQAMFQLPNITQLRLGALQGVGEFINALDNRLLLLWKVLYFFANHFGYY